MRITAMEEYGLRCLLQIASGELLSASEIASREGISVPYAAKLLNVLKKAGLVKSTRGTGGGYSLGRAPAEIALAEVIKTFDGAFFDTDFCKYYSGNRPECVRLGSLCNQRLLWSVLDRRIDEVLSKVTIEDLVFGKVPVDL